MDPIALLLVDDHTIVRSGLRFQLEQTEDLTVVAEAGSMDEAIVKAQQHRWQVAIVDAQLPDASGIETCRRLLAQRTGAAGLILSTFDWDVYLAQAWAAGAAGVVLKSDAPEELVRAVRQAARGERLFSAAQLQRVQAWQREVETRLQTLTRRELEVMRLVVAGYTNPEIAQALAISLKTVEQHVSKVLSKLEVSSRRDIVAWAIRTKALTAGWCTER